LVTRTQLRRISDPLPPGASKSKSFAKPIGKCLEPQASGRKSVWQLRTGFDSQRHLESHVKRLNRWLAQTLISGVCDFPKGLGGDEAQRQAQLAFLCGTSNHHLDLFIVRE
jgi:hypothetical protein